MQVVCSKYFRRQNNLGLMIDVSYYTCPVCNKTFKGNMAIANHIFSHTKYSQKHQDWIESNVKSRAEINDLGKAKLGHQFIYIMNNQCKQA